MAQKKLEECELNIFLERGHANKVQKYITCCLSDPEKES